MGQAIVVRRPDDVVRRVIGVLFSFLGSFGWQGLTQVKMTILV